MEQKEDKARYMREWYRKNKDRIRQSVRARIRKYKKSSKGKAAIRRYKQAYSLRNPEKVAAWLVLKNAIRTGALIRKPCGLCGSENAHAHHPDYSKPLEIEWLCRAHHMEKHQLEGY